MLPVKKAMNILKSKQSSIIYSLTRASICHKSELPEQRYKPFDYESKQYRFPYTFLDPLTKHRFNENSKIVLVEGNVHCGKHDFARRLADELGMKLMPEIDLEKHYITRHGYDLRALNQMVPERLKLCDFEMFHENPYRHSVLHMIFFVYKLRLLQYIYALQHVFNTGQGVVMVRSAFTERVFIEAMHEIGWLPTGYNRADGARFYDFRHHYIYFRMNTCARLLRPHLTIYLDTKVETCLKNIKNSKDPIIANSKALVPEFLEGIKTAYENVILPKMETGGNLIAYDYEERATDEEIRDVVDDISKLDFTVDSSEDTRFMTWLPTSMFWHHNTRYKFSTLGGVQEIFEQVYVDDYDIAGKGDSILYVDMKLRRVMLEANLEPLGITKYAHRNLKYSSSFFQAMTGFGHFHTKLHDIVVSDIVTTGDHCE